MSRSADDNNYESTFHTLPVTPASIGKYEIIEEVGRGSMGTVYAAYDAFADRKVAIKIANPGAARINKADRFRKLPLWGQIVVVMIVLIVAWSLLQIVLGIVRALIPITILAVIIVGLLWVFDKIRD